VYLLFCAAIFAVPTIVAAVRSTGKAGIVFLLTWIPFVGWFIALYKAATYETATEKLVREAAAKKALHDEEFRHAQLLAAVSNK
jgi:hypothetical protein